jgi:hypothetical protein
MFADATSQRLPIVIGVTGHRDVRPENEPVLAEALDAIFTRLETGYPSTPLLLLTPLAEGADQLAAEVARRRSIPYRVPLPMPLADYRQDFPAGPRLARFDELLRCADGAPYAMPYFESNDVTNVAEPARRAHQYALLAAHLARVSHVLIAMWDGVASDTVGGTAQAVRFRVLGVPKRYRPTNSVIDAPETGPVHHIYTARSTDAELAYPIGTHTLRLGRERGQTARAAAPFSETFERIDEVPGTVVDPFETLYRRIDTFNQDCVAIPAAGSANADDRVTASLMRAAERVASYYQKKFVRALQRLFFASALALLVFELYAHVLPNAHPLVAVYLAASCFAVWTYVRARRGRWQDRAQDYRALELGLNVQQAWDAAGLGQSVADFYIRRQRTELDWIRDAIRTAHTIEGRQPFDEARGIATVRAFVMRQYTYFAGTGDDPRVAAYAGGRSLAGAAKRERDKAERHDRFSRLALGTSFAFSAMLVVYGFVAWLAPAVLHGVPNEDVWHGSLIFIIATTAIAAALFHDYPARRAHPQHARRYEVMGGICGRALDALDAVERGETWREAEDGPLPSRIDVARACILELGHEALSENGDWLLLHRELPIELLAVG